MFSPQCYKFPHDFWYRAVSDGLFRVSPIATWHFPRICSFAKLEIIIKGFMSANQFPESEQSEAVRYGFKG